MIRHSISKVMNPLPLSIIFSQLYDFYNTGLGVLYVKADSGLSFCYITNKPSKALHYATRASDPVYVIHMLILTLIGYMIL